MERSYHIFYQLLQPYGIFPNFLYVVYIFYINGFSETLFPLGDGICEGGLRAKCRTSDDIYDYIYVSQGKTKVEIHLVTQTPNLIPGIGRLH